MHGSKNVIEEGRMKNEYKMVNSQTNLFLPFEQEKNVQSSHKDLTVRETTTV